MIEIKQVSKSFGKIKAVTDASLTIQGANVFGLLGTNGAGKSTLMRMITGVLKPDKGEILIDGENVWDNPRVKEKLFYISDDQFWFPNATVKDLIPTYKLYYSQFDEERFRELLKLFNLEERHKIQTFSKGMKKQLSLLLGICANVKYLFCDETFDGLDPVMRQSIKSILASEMDEKQLTPVIASHNLRELEDICDHVGLLHKGGVLLSKDLADLKCNLQKIQCVLPQKYDESLKSALEAFATLELLRFERKGRLITMIVRGEREHILEVLDSMNPVYCEALPLSLEEIFINETEVAGYEIKTLLF